MPLNCAFVLASRPKGAPTGDNFRLVESETPGNPAWQSLLVNEDANTVSSMLDRATLLGVDLLRGHKIDLLASTRKFGGTKA